MTEDIIFEAIRKQALADERESRLSIYLKTLRGFLHKTLRKVSEESKTYGDQISISFLADVEKGKFIPSATKLITLAKIYRVSAQRFLDLIDLDKQVKLRPTGETLETLEARAKEAFELGDYVQAHALLETALTFDMKEEHRVLINNRKATCLWKMGKLHWARDEFEAVLGNFEIDKTLKYQAYANLSAVFRQMRNFELSRAMALQALSLAEILEEADKRGIILNTLGNLDYDLYDARARRDPFLLTRAIEHYQDALNCFNGGKSIHKLHRVVAVMNLGNCHILAGEKEKGFRDLKEAVKLSQALKHPRYLALAWHGTGKGFYEEKNYEKAKECFHKSESGATEHGYPDIRFANNYYLWRIAQSEGNEVVMRGTYKTLCYLLKQFEGDSIEIVKFLDYLRKEKDNDD